MLKLPCHFFLHLIAVPIPEEFSEEYHTDYDEEAVESALSDLDMSCYNSEQGEETADTVRTALRETIKVKLQQSNK